MQDGGAGQQGSGRREWRQGIRLDRQNVWLHGERAVLFPVGSVANWHRLLRLGELYGWRPEGTLVAKCGGDGHRRCSLPDAGPSACGTTPCGQPKERVRDYEPGGGRAVAESDAAALAAALEKSLPDLPDRLEDNLADSANLLEALGGKRKWQVRDLVSYCRRGPFVIW